ncbi:MAG: hypothetical protein JWM53_883 [bacterium]|nr:hypothetical protein [bacterium]
MRYGAILMGVFLSSPIWADDTKEAEPVVEPQADAQLHKMSDYLDGLKSFRVAATTVDEKVTTDGQKIQDLKESTMAAKRPNALRVDRLGPAGRVVFRYDGKQFSIDAIDKKVYAVAPAPATIEAAVDAAREQLKIDAPAGDLIVRDSYHALLDGVGTGRYVGLEPVGDRMAHHLAMTKKDVDYQIWIADGARPVPVRYVITSKDLPGHPEFTVELRNWEPNAAVAADSVAFTPPPGAKQVAFAPQSKAKNQ